MYTHANQSLNLRTLKKLLYLKSTEKLQNSDNLHNSERTVNNATPMYRIIYSIYKCTVQCEDNREDNIGI